MLLKRLLLLLLVTMMVALSIQGRWQASAPGAWAQEFTPTFTPFGTPPGFTSPLIPTPTKVIKVAHEIRHPRSGDAAAGFMEIRGYAVANNFRRYDVHIAVASSESWQWLTTNFTPVYDDVIYILNTTSYADGLYDLRVRVLQDNGRYTETFIRNLEIRNANPPTATLATNDLGTAYPTPTPTIPTATPTWTPEFISNISDGQGIFAPTNNGLLRGVVKVIGTANNKPNVIYERYELALSPTGHEGWDLLVASQDQIWQDVLYRWDTRLFPDGAYDLRLRVVYEDSNYDEYQVRNLTIANYTQLILPTATPTPPTKGIFSPVSGAIITGTISLIGTANMPNFQRWELAWSPGGANEWSTLINSTTPINNGVLARLDLSLLPPGVYDFRLRIVNWKNQAADYVTSGLQLPPPTPTPTLTPIPTDTPFPTDTPLPQ